MANDKNFETSEYKWYDHKWVVILLLIIFFPVGFYALYKNRSFSSKAKWIVAGVFGLLIIAGLSVDENETVATSSEAIKTSQAAEVASSSSADISENQTKEDNIYNIDEPFRLGDFGYVVQNVQAVREIGNEYINEEASSNASFVIITFNIQNFSDETETVLTDDLEIKDERGRTFSPSSDANTALIMVSDKDFILSQLQPGIAKTTKTVFEVPTQVVNNGFLIIFREKGIFSSGNAKIRVPAR